MVKGQNQTAGLNVVSSIFLDPFAGKLPSLVQWLHDAHWWSRSKLLVFEKMLSAQYLLTPYLESCQNWYSEWLQSRWPLLMFRSHGQRSCGQTADLHLTLCLMVTKLPTLVDFREDYSYCLLGHKVNVKLLVFISALSAQNFKNHLLDIYQTWYSGCHERVDYSLYICNPIEFCTRWAFLFFIHFLF